MAAAPGGAAPAPVPACACSNISIMQLFHELKQEFPGVPDHVVSDTISAHCHDPEACRDRLHGEEEARRALAALHPARSRHAPPPPPHPQLGEPPRCPNRVEPVPQSETQRKDRGEPSTASGDAVRPKRPDSLPLSSEKNSATRRELEDGFPLNVSVNLNCRMDVPKPTPDPVQMDFASPSSFASVNFTVCTPTSARGFPAEIRPGSARPDSSSQRGFEGRVHITVSSGPAQSPYLEDRSSSRRRQTVALDVAERSPSDAIESLIKRQRLQLDRLQRAIKADHARIIRIRREIQILEAPAPTSNATLQVIVQRLRDGCQILDRQIEAAPLSGDDDVNDTASSEQCLRNRTSEDGDSWQCHVCTFRNHALLNKCEECDMPRIILVHANDEVTVQLHPGCDEVTGSWIS